MTEPDPMTLQTFAFLFLLGLALLALIAVWIEGRPK